MGYTHYWTLSKGVDELPEGLLANARHIMDAADVTLCGPNGEGEPIVNSLVIALNGTPRNDEWNESFHIDIAYGDDSTKTARKPYDKVVCALLIDAWVHGVLTFQSDGNAQDWAEGLALYSRVVGLLTPTRYAELMLMLGSPE